MSEFFLPKIEIRSSINKGIKQYVVKGYAATTGNIYSYSKLLENDGTPIKCFKEYFTDKAIESIKKQSKSENIFVDYGHQNAFNINMNKSLTDIEVRSGLNLKEEKEYIRNAAQLSDIPMFKIEEIQIDDKGLFVEVRGNPFYREVDEEHAKYFDSIWGSLENGFINGMSLNMKPTETIQINEDITQIDDVDVYGISLMSGSANDMANITEVAIRCIEHVRGEKCQKKTKKIRRMML